MIADKVNVPIIASGGAGKALALIFTKFPHQLEGNLTVQIQILPILIPKTGAAAKFIHIRSVK